jgi:NADPH:quinone reductase-like Zn-dependent oxidoreductase
MSKIIQFKSLGGPEVLAFKDIVLSKELGLDEVLYSVKAFALNRSDWLLSAGYHYTIPELPSRIGSEASGIVKAMGKNVTKFQVGDKVTSIPFFTSKYLVHGEVAITPEKYLTHCPSNLNFIESCSIWMQYLTAYYPFVEIAKIRPGDFVLIGAASSSAGLGAIDIVKSCGGRVIATTRSDKKITLLKNYGADEVINTPNDDLKEKVMHITNNKGLRAVYDPIGNPFYQQYLDALGMGSIIFHLVWLFPLAFISASKPEMGLILFLLAIYPVVLVTIRFGPLFSIE